MDHHDARCHGRDLGGSLYAVDVAACASSARSLILKTQNLSDLNAREIGLLLPLMILMLFMGVYPRVFLDRSKASVEGIRARVNASPAGGSYTTLK